MPKVRFKVNGQKARFESSTSKSWIIFMFKLSDQKTEREERQSWTGGKRQKTKTNTANVNIYILCVHDDNTGKLI